MKSNFRFFFQLVIVTGVLFALLYALGPKLVEENLTVSFVMFSLIVTGIGGMIANLPSAPAERAK